MTPLNYHLHEAQIRRLPFDSYEPCGSGDDPGFRIRSPRGPLVEFYTHEEACEKISILAGEWIAVDRYRNQDGRDHESNKIETLHTVQNNVGHPYDTQAALQAAIVMYDELVRAEVSEPDEDEIG